MTVSFQINRDVALKGYVDDTPSGGIIFDGGELHWAYAKLVKFSKDNRIYLRTTKDGMYYKFTDNGFNLLKLTYGDLFQRIV
jgi:hypothetical protein